MAEYLDPTIAELNGAPLQVVFTDEPAPAPVNPATDDVPEPQVAPAPQPAVKLSSRHVEAGRKGAERIHQLIERGKLYEQEHDLKRGRQRLRQLIEEGKLYEQEHGLRPRRRKRDARLSQEQLLRRLVDSLVRIAKPSYRPGLLKLVQALEGAGD